MNKGLKGLINAVSYAFFVILKSTHCSEIFAELHDRVTDYCTDQRAMCEHTGSYIHIVCEYYGKPGSSCSSYGEVRLGESDVEEILRRINTIRIHVAKGEATGQDGQTLPRAYGMRKIFWDNELAAFAQIMVAQCLTKHRYSCATTKTFSNPMMVYTFANTTSSAAAIIDNIFSNWEAERLLTQDDIFQSPDLKEKESQVYIKLVVGNASHVGCAIGAYEHEIRPYAIEAYDNLQLSGHLVCYISHYSETGTPVYNTTAPVKGTGWTRCGCPPGLRETKDCLCVASKNMSSLTTSTKAYYNDYEKYMNEMRQILEATKQEQEEQEVSEIQQQDKTTEPTELESTPKWTQAHPKQETGVGTPTPTCNDQGKCEPKIVMLPIFTIQNGPKNVNRRRGPGQYRRSDDGTSFVQSDKTTDELSVSEEKNEVLPKNISLRSKLLESVRAIRNQEAVHFFSDEQNGPNNQIMEQSQRIMKPSEQMLKTTTQESDDRNSNEKAKKKVNRLLELLEEKGKKTQLSSKEMIEFDAKMRRIYKTVLGTVENFQF